MNGFRGAAGAGGALTRIIGPPGRSVTDIISVLT